MLPELSERLLRDWPRLFPETRQPGRIDYLGIAGSVEGGTTTFLAFAPKSTRPLFAVKIHRHIESVPRAITEGEVLHALQPHRAALSAEIPRPVVSEPWPSGWVSVQSILDGRPMPASLTSRGVPDLAGAVANFDVAARFLLSLRGATLRRTPDAVDELVQRAVDAVETIEREFDPSQSERAYLAELRAQLPDALKEGGNVQHGDFCRHNLLIRSRGGPAAAVLDWTDSCPLGAPLHDLFFFISTYYLQIRAKVGLAGFVGAFDDTFLTDGPYRRLVVSCVADFCRKAAINAKVVRTLFGLFLIERSLYDLAQLQSCARQGMLPRFTISLAAAEGATYVEAVRAQFWFAFFRRYVERRGDFTL